MDLLRSLLTQIKNGHCTPILGWGLTDSLLGPRRMMARHEWAETFEFPLAVHFQDDLPQVANFVAVMTDVATLRESLGEFYREQLRSRYPELRSNDASVLLSDLVRQAWTQQAAHESDPYVRPGRSALPDLRQRAPDDVAHRRADGARQGAGRRALSVAPRGVRLARVDLRRRARLRARRAAAAGVPRLRQHRRPRFAGPHRRRLLRLPHQRRRGRRRSSRSPVRRRWPTRRCSSSGSGSTTGTSAMLLRSLVSQEGAQQAAEVHPRRRPDRPRATAVAVTGRAHRYLERYFGKFREPAIDIFWGTVDEFAAGLAEVWERPRDDRRATTPAWSPSRVDDATEPVRRARARSATASRSTAGPERSTSCANLLVAERIVLLYSPSGAGKTLAARSRAASRARAAATSTCSRPSGSAIEPADLAGRALRNRYVLSMLLSLEEGGRPRRAARRRRAGDDRRSPTYLGRLVADACRPGLDPCLVFDQFEELFTLDPTDHAAKADVPDRARRRAARPGPLGAVRDARGLHRPARPLPRAHPESLGDPVPAWTSSGRMRRRPPIRRTAADAGVDFTERSRARCLVDDLRRVQVQRGRVTTDELGPMRRAGAAAGRLPAALGDPGPAGARRSPRTTSSPSATSTTRSADFYVAQVRAVAERTGVERTRDPRLVRRGV